MRLLVAILVAVICASAADAQDYPDLKGTWAGTVEAVRLRPDPDQVMGSGDPEVKFVELPVTLAIEQQNGRRFAGTVGGDGWSKQLVGVLASDDVILWAESDGIVQAWLRVDGVLEYCYLEADDQRQMAACATLTRQ